MQNFELWRNLAYLVAAVLFIFGIKGLTHPRTAVRGNMFGALGMLIAAVVTVLWQEHFTTTGWVLIAIGVLIGAGVGGWMAVNVQMTAMPQMVALLNGFGGIASALVAGAALHEARHVAAATPEWSISNVFAAQNQEPMQAILAIVISGIIGGVTFTGSIVAFGKLQEIPAFEKLTFPAQKAFNLAVGILLAVIGAFAIRHEANPGLFWPIVFLSFTLGVTLVSPIGGADMPVVISLLNSYSGIAAAATGFVINNNVLIIAGSLVGASGLILTKIMCVAMNRSLTNVLFGVMAAPGSGPSADDVYAGKVKSATAEEVALLFDGAQRVVFVPGYGMAVSQAQHAVRDLANLLEGRGIKVEYAIHPVAGRMPGHMNVLLAEADVPYDKLKEMDEINSEIEQVDVAIVIGANDTVNPIARTDPNCPIAGMPIVNVDKARTVVVIKRSLSPGFAGIPNPLFAGENTLMMFGDGKKAVTDLIAAVKEAA